MKIDKYKRVDCTGKPASLANGTIWTMCYLIRRGSTLHRDLALVPAPPAS